jgi:tRNA threonylcarbamoyl adenosine modification protein (Sua5/YciO/YrdC/YwlC family)
VSRSTHAKAPHALARRNIPRLDVNAVHPEPHKIRQAAALVESGRVVVYPTDTIYGLGADLTLRPAIDRLYQLRRLDPDKPLSLVCRSLGDVGRFAIIPDDCFQFMRRVLPGPYTFVLKATPEAPRMGRSKRRTIGVRVPDSPVARALVDALGRPLISTSAIFDSQNGSDPIALAETLDPQSVGLVLDAGLLDGVPSSVIDWTDEEPVVLREGAGDVSDLVSP